MKSESRLPRHPQGVPRQRLELDLPQSAPVVRPRALARRASPTSSSTSTRSRCTRNTLRPTYTLGLGLISFFLFVILVVTGILLMFYYVPSPSRPTTACSTCAARSPSASSCATCTAGRRTAWSRSSSCTCAASSSPAATRSRASSTGCSASSCFLLTLFSSLHRLPAARGTSWPSGRSRSARRSPATRRSSASRSSSCCSATARRPGGAAPLLRAARRGAAASS